MSQANTENNKTLFEQALRDFKNCKTPEERKEYLESMKIRLGQAGDSGRTLLDLLHQANNQINAAQQKG